MATNKPYRVRTFNEVTEMARSLPPAVPLYGHFFYKNELSILAGDTGVGKSIFAVGISIGIANGGAKVHPFHGTEDPLSVLYVDYELSDVQFYNRFPRNDFPDNLRRVDQNPEQPGVPISLASIKDLVETYRPEVLIIDNLTTMLGGSAQEGDVAINAMIFLNNLKVEMNLTIIVLAHTPKLYFNQPLRVEHVGGSKFITNLADSVVFIAKSIKSPNTRYLKHVKMRNSEDSGVVFDLELTKSDIIQFKYIGESAESTHLEQSAGSNFKEGRLQKMLLMREEGAKMHEIAAALDCDKATVSRYLSKKSAL